MTYKEFMKTFEDYKQIRVQATLAQYSSNREAAEAIGISPSTITRIFQGKKMHSAVSKLIGEDIEEIDITEDAVKKFQIKMLEEKLKELKGE